MSTTVLTAAHTELFRRPPEEQFGSFEELRTAAAEQRKRCHEVECRERDVLFSESGLVHLGDHTVAPTHYSMAQLATMARVPMALLERLKPETRASVLNQTFPRGRKHKAGLAEGDDLRCVTSDRFERVWDDELYEVLDRWIVPSGFIPAVPTMGPGAGVDSKPALFRSDRDSFAFFYSTEDPHDAFGGLRKGVVVFNSEVGAKSLGYSTFIFREVCGNFLIWGAEGVTERKQRHTSTVRDLFNEFDRELRTISNQVSPFEYAVIEKAARTPFVESGSVEDAAKRLQKEFGIPRDLVPEVLEAVSLPENPGDLSVWGVVNGLTSVAKLEAYAEGRVALAATAGDLLTAR
jgi:hypothetical protein